MCGSGGTGCTREPRARIEVTEKKMVPKNWRWAPYQVSASFAIFLTESTVYCGTWKLFFLRTCLVRGIRGDNTWCHQNSWKITRFLKRILRDFSSYLQKIGSLTKSWHFNIIGCAMKAMFWFLLIGNNFFFSPENAHFRFDQSATTVCVFPHLRINCLGWNMGAEIKGRTLFPSE